MKKTLLLSLIVIIVGQLNWSGEFSNYSSSRQVFSDTNELLRMTLSDDDKYRVRNKKSIHALELEEAFLKKEDQYFYYHYGVNPFSLLRAAFKTYVLKNRIIGGSTITMQLARLHYKLNTRNVLGKMDQIFKAIWLELSYSKKEILTAYLNLVPFGKNIEGIEAASYIYFQKQARDLSSLEASFIASIPQNPALMNMHTSFSRVPVYLEKKAWELYLSLNPQGEKKEIFSYGIENLPFKAPHFSNWILSTTKKRSISSTLNTNLQTALEKSMDSYIFRKQGQGIKNASAILLDYKTMQLKAMVGSADFHDSSINGQVNGALALRSPGSTIKPFIYGLAFQEGLIIPQSILFDAPLKFRTPENFDQKHVGPITAEQALVQSRNIPAVDLASRLSQKRLHTFLRDLFPHRVSSRDIYGSSLSLGGLEFSMLDLVQLYAMLGNDGQWRSILTHKESEEIEKSIKLKSFASSMVLDVLSKNLRSDSIYESFLEKNIKVHWKTGTSFGFRDAWSIGVFGQYVLAVWIGDFSGKGHPSYIGGQAAGPLFFEIFDKLSGELNSEFALNKSLKEVSVCSVSGKLPNTNCKATVKSLFMPGVSPIEKCKIHRAYYVDIDTGLRICTNDKVRAKEKVFEVSL